MQGLQMKHNNIKQHALIIINHIYIAPDTKVSKHLPR